MSKRVWRPPARILTHAKPDPTRPTVNREDTGRLAEKVQMGRPKPVRGLSHAEGARSGTRDCIHDAMD